MQKNTIGLFWIVTTETIKKNYNSYSILNLTGLTKKKHHVVQISINLYIIISKYLRLII